MALEAGQWSRSMQSTTPHHYVATFYITMWLHSEIICVLSKQCSVLRCLGSSKGVLLSHGPPTSVVLVLALRAGATPEGSCQTHPAPQHRHN